MGRVKRGDAGRGHVAASARPDVDGVEAPKLGREPVLTADQKQLIGVGVLGAEPVLACENTPPQRDAADGDRASLPQRRELLIGPPVVLPDARVTPKEILGQLSRPEGVDAALVALYRRRGAVRRALRLESRLGGPAHVVPRERLEPVRVVMAAHMPKSPGDDRDAAVVHAGTGSLAGSSAGAGTGTGSSSGAISISCSVSGAPMSIRTSLELSSEIPGKSYRASRMA